MALNRSAVNWVPCILNGVGAAGAEGAACMLSVGGRRRRGEKELAWIRVCSPRPLVRVLLSLVVSCSCARALWRTATARGGGVEKQLSRRAKLFLSSDSSGQLTSESPLLLWLTRAYDCTDAFPFTVSDRPRRSAKPPKRLEDAPPPPPRKPIPVDPSPLSSHASSVSPQNTRTAPSTAAAVPPPKRRKTSNAGATSFPAPALATAPPIAFPTPRTFTPPTNPIAFPQPKPQSSFPTPSFPQPSTSGTTVKRPNAVKKPPPKIAPSPSPPPLEISVKRSKVAEEVKTVTAELVEVGELKSAVLKGKGGKEANKGKGKEVREEEAGKGKGKDVVAKEQRKDDLPTPPPRKRPRVEATSSVSSSSIPKRTIVAPPERKNTLAASSALSRPPAKVIPSTSMDLNDKDAYSSLFKSASISFKVRSPHYFSLPCPLIGPNPQKTGGPVQKAPVIRPGEVRLADPALVAYVLPLRPPSPTNLVTFSTLAPPPISREAKLREIKLKRESERRQLAESAVRRLVLL